MMRFEWLEQRGTSVARMSGVDDGDCGWDGCATGTRAAFLARIAVPAAKLVVLRQCHGDRIWPVGPGEAGKGAHNRDGALGDGDGLITNTPGIPLGINIADCVPLLLSGGGAAAAVHAGRVGTELGIARRAVLALEDTFKTEPSALFAVIGPSAGPCCYQVGPDILEKARKLGLSVVGDRLDLWESNRRQLLEAGVPGTQIFVSRHCTLCNPGFFSYRARGTAERNMAVIML